ncbi:MAG: hypothetical protein J5717_01960 [Lachnospiraceae bacterium]|nr:hypothetical protein [Lachnospiraceae bacterium]
MEISDKDFGFNDHYNCYQCAIEAAANIYGVDYQMIGLGTCNFMYIRDNDLIGNRIKPHFFRDTKAWKRYSKLVINELDFSCLDEDKFIRLLKEYKVILVYGDVFFCPWTKVYHQKHNFHAFLIVGYNESTDMFQVVDTYMGSNIISCPFWDIQSQISGLYYFDLRPEPFCDEEQYIDEIRRDAEFYFDKESDKHIADFVDDMLSKFSFELEINYSGSNTYMVPLISNLDMLLRNRKGYEILLEYYSRRFMLSNGDNSIELIKKSIKSISKIKLELLKSGIRKRYMADSEMAIKNELLAWEKAELELMNNLIEI